MRRFRLQHRRERDAKHLLAVFIIFFAAASVVNLQATGYVVAGSSAESMLGRALASSEVASFVEYHPVYHTAVEQLDEAALHARGIYDAAGPVYEIRFMANGGMLIALVAESGVLRAVPAMYVL